VRLLNLEVAKHIVKKQNNFTPFALECLEGRVYGLSPHQQLIGDTLDRVMSGEIKRLIINIPPGFAKTAIAVWSFVARGFAYNPKSKFLHISYSDTLVQDNSANIRTIINSQDYQQLFPYVQFKEDTKAKGLWKTDQGGAFRASASGGAVTGFRAGLIDANIFSGALLIDDPLKPDDASSDTVRNFINGRWKNVFRSRLASHDTPVIVVMQRLHEDDFTAHLLSDSGEQWHHLVLPSYIDPAYVYDIDGNGIYIQHDLPAGSLWPQKYNDEQALALMTDGQYNQNPKPLKGEIFEKHWFLKYDVLPPIKKYCIYCDTASKINAWNDWSVFGFFGVGFDNKGYVIDIERIKVEVPFLKEKFTQFYYKCNAMMIGGETIQISIEDKDSGVGLIQGLRVDGFKVRPIKRDVNKISRAVKTSPRIKDGFVFIPNGAIWVGLYVEEFVKFKADMTHKHDDQIDPTMDFIENELMTIQRPQPTVTSIPTYSPFAR
jgi:predicted phage terminase large subunit-like protein